jgi:hypothetical protein
MGSCWCNWLVPALTGLERVMKNVTIHTSGYPNKTRAVTIDGKSGEYYVRPNGKVWEIVEGKHRYPTNNVIMTVSKFKELESALKTF